MTFVFNSAVFTRSFVFRISSGVVGQLDLSYLSITIMIEKPTECVCYIYWFLYTSLHRSPVFDSPLVNWNFQYLNTVFHLINNIEEKLPSSRILTFNSQEFKLRQSTSTTTNLFQKFFFFFFFIFLLKFILVLTLLLCFEYHNDTTWGAGGGYGIFISLHLHSLPN